MEEKKYKISTLRGYADLLFQKGQIQVPFITNIQAFLDDFERWAELAEKMK